MMHRISSCTAALVLLAAAAPAAAQRSTSDRDLSNRQHSGGLSGQDRNRFDELKADDAKRGAAVAAEWERRQALLRLPPPPVERNVLLGRWRREEGPSGQIRPGNEMADALAVIRDLNSAPMGCDLRFGNSITFASSTFSINQFLGPVFTSQVAYRSIQKQVIVAIPIPGNSDVMGYEIAGSNRIKWGNCVLVRVGAPAANAAANAATAPGNARTGAANSSLPTAAGAMPQVAAVAPSPPPSTLSRPSPEVCRNTLVDKLGTVGTNQVRAMSDVRFKEAAIEGKVPNTNHLRIDLRGSACDDPRIKATLYDFDANEMLQSITYVWDRPAGPAPAPIFSERITQLSRFHSLPPPQSPGRLQADTSLGRLIVEDMPERNLLLEAYKTKK